MGGDGPRGGGGSAADAGRLSAPDSLPTVGGTVGGRWVPTRLWPSEECAFGAELEEEAPAGEKPTVKGKDRPEMKGTL